MLLLMLQTKNMKVSWYYYESIVTSSFYNYETIIVHQEHLDDTDKLLRAFDLNYAFGPCVGIKRSDRWGKNVLVAELYTKC